MAKVNPTKSMIARMLTENTGQHMLDSGGAYGRHWEHNQGRDFESEPEGTLEFWIRNGDEVDIVPSLSTYHWLVERLDYDAKLDRRFYRWATRPSRANEPWLVSMEGFTEHLRARGEHVTGIYGDGEPFTDNTYNHEDMLSQTLQFHYFEWDHEPYVLLQIHGGCDVRGGYTRARAFRVSNDGTDILDCARGTIYCERQDKSDPNQVDLPGMPPADDTAHYWTTDDTAHWYYQGSAGYAAGRQLEDYQATDNDERRGQGLIYVDDERNGYCPKCGGKLVLSGH